MAMMMAITSGGPFLSRRGVENLFSYLFYGSWGPWTVPWCRGDCNLLSTRGLQGSLNPKFKQLENNFYFNLACNCSAPWTLLISIICRERFWHYQCFSAVNIYSNFSKSLLLVRFVSWNSAFLSQLLLKGFLLSIK